MTPEQIAAEQAKLAAQAAELKKQQDALTAQSVNFAERETAIKQQEAQVKKTEITTLVDGLVTQGRVLPKDKANLVEFMAHLNEADVIEFAENDAKVKHTLFSWLKNWLGTLPVQVNFAEHTPNAATVVTTGKVDDKMIAIKARQYRDQQIDLGNTISFAEAVDHVNLTLGVSRNG